MDAKTYGMQDTPRRNGPATGGGNPAPGGTNPTDNILLSALAGGTDYGDWQGVQRQNEQLARHGQAAASKALSSIDTPNGTQPHVDISRLLAALKARGVDTMGTPSLGTNQKPQLGSA